MLTGWGATALQTQAGGRRARLRQGQRVSGVQAPQAADPPVPLDTGSLVEGHRPTQPGRGTWSGRASRQGTPRLRSPPPVENEQPRGIRGFWFGAQTGCWGSGMRRDPGRRGWGHRRAIGGVARAAGGVAWR